MPYKLKNKVRPIGMKVEVSIGEAIDKLSILEIKAKNIPDEVKRVHIQKEIDALSECEPYKQMFYYRILVDINQRIWDTTDRVKQLTPDDTLFASLANDIFELNQKRFRIKNWYNLAYSSELKEQKGYGLRECHVWIEDIETFYEKLSVLLAICLDHDQITVISKEIDAIQSILTIPTVVYSTDFVKNCIDLKSYEIDKEMFRFELKPIVYVSGGLLGDFVYQLSVIQEIYMKTGRKGILYISKDMGGDHFRFGLERTYQDTYRIVSSQPYILDYKIYQKEPYDINLSMWRCNNIEIPWDQIFFHTYRVEWGKHPWIKVPYDPQWKDVVLVTTTSYHAVHNIDYSTLFKEYGPQLQFMDLSDKETELFKTTHGIEPVLYKPADLYEMCVAIQSCKLFIANYSSPLSFAYGMHKECVVGMCYSDDIRHVGLEQKMPHLTICPDRAQVMDTIRQKLKN
jgi:hypothetical protein